MTTTRPKTPGCLIFVTAILTIYQTIFAISVLQHGDVLGYAGLPTLLQSVLALIWAAIFFIVTVGLVRLKPHALRYSGWFIITFVIYNIVRLAAFVRADYDRNRLPFLVLLTAVILIVPLLLVSRRS